MDAGKGGQLESLAATLARARGEEFFPVLAQYLAGVLGAREAHICEAAPGGRVRTLGAWRDGGFIPNYEYLLDDAPSGGGNLFSLPLAAKDGAVLGHLLAWIDSAAPLTPAQRDACAVLADRAGAELRLVHVKRERSLLRAQVRQLRGEIHAVHDIDAIVGTSLAHARVIDEMRRVAAADASVLINGEPGTGKELVARAVHAWSPRGAKPFTRVDCAALNVDADLKALPQICALTSGGTLFFDEVGALPLELQARLLAALPASGERRDPAVADVRVVASTNRDLRKAMRDGVFREDLFYRLNVFPIDIPPLRTRIEDIAPLVHHFVRRLTQRLGRRIESIDPNSLAELGRHSWPGNVRELATLVERSMVTHSGPVLKMSADLFATASPAERAALIAAAAVDTATSGRHALDGTVDFDDTLNTGLHAVQREHILRVLNATHWVIEGTSGAALKLGMKPATLRHRMKKLGISRAQNPQAN